MAWLVTWSIPWSPAPPVTSTVPRLRAGTSQAGCHARRRPRRCQRRRRDERHGGGRRDSRDGRDGHGTQGTWGEHGAKLSRLKACYSDIFRYIQNMWWKLHFFEPTSIATQFLWGMVSVWKKVWEPSNLWIDGLYCSFVGGGAWLSLRCQFGDAPWSLSSWARSIQVYIKL